MYTYIYMYLFMHIYLAYLPLYLSYLYKNFCVLQASEERLNHIDDRLIKVEEGLLTMLYQRMAVLEANQLNQEKTILRLEQENLELRIEYLATVKQAIADMDVKLDKIIKA